MPRTRWVDYTILIILMVITFLLRYHSLTEFSLTNDELSSWVRSNYPSYHLVWDKGILTDGHPPFTYLFLHTWIHFFGYSVLALRLPFIIASSLSIYMLYIIGARWFTRPAALCAAAVIAVGQYFVFTGILCRPYAFGQLFLLLTIYFGDNWRKSNAHVVTTERLAFILFAALGCITHYFSFLAIVIYSLVLFIYVPRKTKVALAAAGAVIILLLLTCTHVFITQLGYGGLEWLGKPSNDYLQTIVTAAFNNDDFWAIIISGIVVYSLSTQKIALCFERVVCICCFVISFIVGYYKSKYGSPVLQSMCMYFTLPLFILFMLSAVPPAISYKNYSIPASLLALIIIVYGCHSTINRNKFYTTEHSAEFKKLVLEIDTLAQHYPLDSTVCIANFNSGLYIQFYMKELNCSVPFSIYRCDDAEGLCRMSHILDSVAGKKYCLYTWSNIYYPPQTDSIIRRHYPRKIFKSHHINSDVRLYGK